MSKTKKALITIIVIGSIVILLGVGGIGYNLGKRGETTSSPTIGAPVSAPLASAPTPTPPPRAEDKSYAQLRQEMRERVAKRMGDAEEIFSVILPEGTEAVIPVEKVTLETNKLDVKVKDRAGSLTTDTVEVVIPLALAPAAPPPAPRSVIPHQVAPTTGTTPTPVETPEPFTGPAPPPR